MVFWREGADVHSDVVVNLSQAVLVCLLAQRVVSVSIGTPCSVSVYWLTVQYQCLSVHHVV